MSAVRNVLFVLKAASAVVGIKYGKEKIKEAAKESLILVDKFSVRESIVIMSV